MHNPDWTGELDGDSLKTSSTALSTLPPGFKVMNSVSPYGRMLIINGSKQKGSGVACWLERPSHDRKVASSILARAAGFFFFLLTFCADSYSVSVPPPVLSQWHIKDSGHVANSAGSRLHLSTHTSLTQRRWSGLTILSRHGVETYRGNELTRSSSWITPSVVSAR